MPSFSNVVPAFPHFRKSCVFSVMAELQTLIIDVRIQMSQTFYLSSKMRSTFPKSEESADLEKILGSHCTAKNFGFPRERTGPSLGEQFWFPP